jgi:hypothetical protein
MPTFTPNWSGVRALPLPTHSTSGACKADSLCVSLRCWHQIRSARASHICTCARARSSTVFRLRRMSRIARSSPVRCPGRTRRMRLNWLRWASPPACRLRPGPSRASLCRSAGPCRLHSSTSLRRVTSSRPLPLGGAMAFSCTVLCPRSPATARAHRAPSFALAAARVCAGSGSIAAGSFADSAGCNADQASAVVGRANGARRSIRFSGRQGNRSAAGRSAVPGRRLRMLGKGKKTAANQANTGRHRTPHRACGADSLQALRGSSATTIEGQGRELAGSYRLCALFTLDAQCGPNRQPYSAPHALRRHPQGNKKPLINQGFEWWRWAESNRRPKALHPRHYMLSSSLDLIPEQHDVRSASRDQPA